MSDVYCLITFVVICGVVLSPPFVSANARTTLNVAEHLMDMPARSERSKRTVLTVDRSLDFISEIPNEVIHKSRQRRKAPEPGAAGISNTPVQLNDTHFQMVIHWAGENSAVIVALTRDIQTTASSTSKLYISRDYGHSFNDTAVKFDGTKDAVLEIFYNSPVFNSHYVFVDVMHNMLFTTVDYAQTIIPYRLLFTPKEILMHPRNWEIIIGRDPTDYFGRTYLSTNFGLTWSLLRNNVKAIFWGVAKYDDDDTVYVQTKADVFSSSSIVQFTSITSAVARRETVLLVNVIDFTVVNQFMFATRNVTTAAIVGPLWNLELWVSYNRGAFAKSDFAGNHMHVDYFIADATEDQVFVCANHNNTASNLYTSDARGTRFALSLENVFYFNPTNPNNANNWLKQMSGPAFADLMRVDGLPGIYIATQLGSLTTPAAALASQRSLITFNKGGEWRHLVAPEKDIYGNETCKRTLSSWLLGRTSCTLNVAQRFHTSFFLPGDRPMPILSKKSAVGLVLATGNLGPTLSVTGDYSVFRSIDGGLFWKEVLRGTYFYATGDHGSLIVAIKSSQLTGDLLYSLDEGETWNMYAFSSDKLIVYGLLTEPGEKTTIFSIFGSRATSHSWLVIQVDLRGVLGNNCTDDDYKSWSPSDSPNVDCLLGSTTIYERRKPGTICYNGRDYVREISTKSCVCTMADYECDYGYRMNSTTDDIEVGCVYDPDSGVDVNAVPMPCPEGQTYNKSKGYRRVADDVCVGGNRYEPTVTECPVQVHEEFLLFTNRSHIHRYVFERKQDVKLPLPASGAAGQRNILTVDYDYRDDCVLWTEGRYSSIQKMCLRGNQTSQTMILQYANDTDTIEGFAFNWMSRQFFWVDAGRKKIEVARADGTHRKALVKTGLDQPRAIAVYPKFGYLFWSDWSAVTPSITRAYMDGTNQLRIVTGLTNLQWPNGLTVDDTTPGIMPRIFFTDAGLDRISFCNMDGSGLMVLIAHHPLVIHPYSIAVFKDEIYWSDWTTQAVMVADKHSGAGVQKYLSDLPGIMDLKILHHNSQQGTSPCSTNNGGCQSLCFEVPLLPISINVVRTTSRCGCSDMFTEAVTTGGVVQCLCGDGKPVNMTTGFCTISAPNTTCADHQFTCTNGHCIPNAYKCDGDNDCGDRSDELTNCTARTCQAGQYACNNGRCIPSRWVCDRDNDCGDMSDELVRNCSYPSCAVDQFQCDNGRCISSRWRCDHDDDCHDGSDERSCNTTSPTPVGNCSATQFTCVYPHGCIPLRWKCDGGVDCVDGSDERNCNSTRPLCSTSEYQCVDGTCIPVWQRCNGRADCLHNDDEINCNYTTTPRPSTASPSGTCLPGEQRCSDGSGCLSITQLCDGIPDCEDFSDEIGCAEMCRSRDLFLCDDGTCIPSFLRCDSHPDCRDRSDEKNCQSTTPSVTIQCDFNSYRCDDGLCIFDAWLCDGEADCAGGSDERNCSSIHVCHDNEFRCLHNGGCIPTPFVCDGVSDCADGTDEASCSTGTVSTTPSTCLAGFFRCRGGDCIPYRYVCDKKRNCIDDDSDEQNCDGKNGYFVVAELVWEATTSNSLSISIHRIVPPTESTAVVTASLQKSGASVVDTKSIPLPMSTVYPLVYVFSGLDPGTEYTITLSTKVLDKAGPTQPPIVASTLEIAPGTPENVFCKVETREGEIGFVVSWKPPTKTGGHITSYRVYYQDVTDPNDMGIRRRLIIPVNPGMTTTTQQTTHLTGLTPGHSYRISVSAFNEIEGPQSTAITKILQSAAGCIKLLAVKQVTSGDKPPDVLLEAYSTALEFGQSVYVMWSVFGNMTIRSYGFHLTSTEINDTQVVTDKDAPDAAGQCTFVCTARVSRLNPESTYDVTVSAVLSDGGSVFMCADTPPLQVTTAGIRPSAPKITAIKPMDGGVMSVSFSIDNTSILMDGMVKVFYQSVTDRLSNGVVAERMTHIQPVTIANLLACEPYQFSVQLTYPMISVPSPIVVKVTASENLAPPKHFTVETVPTNDGYADATLTWQPSACSLSIGEVNHYMVEIVEVSAPPPQIVNNFPVTVNSSFNFQTKIMRLHRGATYNFTVGLTGVADTRKSSVNLVTISPYPGPSDFKATSFLQDDDTIMVHQLAWSDSLSHLGISGGYYDIYHAEGLQPHGDVSGWVNILNFTKLRNTTQTELFLINTLHPGLDHAFKVRVASINGYPSNFTQVEIVYALSSEKLATVKLPHDEKGLSRETLLGIILTCVVVVVVLAVVLLAFIIRHRRLERSFTTYASSRYDRHANSTTFNELEEEDQPMIRCFADDEPLIVG